MADFARILEEELEEAVEVKDRKSLHRYITLLTENIAGEKENRMEHTEFQQELIKMDGRFNQLLTELREGFKRMDQRFESVDKRFEIMQTKIDQRFEIMQTNMDHRFEASDKRFAMMFSFITIGFVILATMMSVFQFLA